MKFIHRHYRLLSIAGMMFIVATMDLLSSCAGNPKSNAKPTIMEAEKFIADAEQRLFELNIKYSRALGEEHFYHR